MKSKIVVCDFFIAFVSFFILLPPRSTTVSHLFCLVVRYCPFSLLLCASVLPMAVQACDTGFSSLGLLLPSLLSHSLIILRVQLHDFHALGRLPLRRPARDLVVSPLLSSGWIIYRGRTVAPAAVGRIRCDFRSSTFRRRSRLSDSRSPSFFSALSALSRYYLIVTSEHTSRRVSLKLSTFWMSARQVS